MARASCQLQIHIYLLIPPEVLQDKQHYPCITKRTQHREVREHAQGQRKQCLSQAVKSRSQKPGCSASSLQAQLPQIVPTSPPCNDCSSFLVNCVTSTVLQSQVSLASLALESDSTCEVHASGPSISTVDIARKLHSSLHAI